MAAARKAEQQETQRLMDRLAAAERRAKLAEESAARAGEDAEKRVRDQLKAEEVPVPRFGPMAAAFRSLVATAALAVTSPTLKFPLGSAGLSK